MLTCGHQLLRQQLPEPACGLDRPGSLRAQQLGPCQQTLRLATIRADFELAQRPLLTVDRDGHVRRLMWINSDDH